MKYSKSINLSFIFLFAFGCGGSDGNDTVVDAGLEPDAELSAEDSSLQGRVVKGPFANKSVVTVHGIDRNGVEENSIKIAFTNTSGQMISTPISYDGWIVLRAEGFYFDELTGEQSTVERKLETIQLVTDQKAVGNLNVFSAFTARRIVSLFVTTDATVAEAREVARTEFSKIFHIKHHPDELGLLNNTTRGLAEDNAVLLLFSAAMLKAEIDDSQYFVLVDDFADDGQINGSGISIFENIRQWALLDLYEIARNNLIQEFGDGPIQLLSAFPLNSWLLGNCSSTISSQFDKFCIGINDAPPLDSTVWKDFSFIAPQDGSFTFTGSFSQYHQFSQWVLNGEDGLLAKGTAQSNWAAVSPILEAGKEYILRMRNSSAEEDVSATLEIETSSQGSRSAPTPLVYDITLDGEVGYRTGMSERSFYVFHQDQAPSAGKLNVSIVDLGGETEVNVYQARYTDDYKAIFTGADVGSLLINKTHASVIDVEIDLIPEVLLFEVINRHSRVSTSVVDTDGTSTFKIRLF